MTIHHRLVIAGSLASIGIVAAASAVFVAARRPAIQQPAPTPTHVVTHSVTAPSEAAVTPTVFHSTAVGNQPKYVKLPSIHAEGYVQNMGIDQQGAIAAPTNVNLAGWYINSVSPGEAGLSIMDGHVDGTTSPGIFYHLAQLAAGDGIEVDLANGQQKQFTVRSVQQLAAQDAAAALFARDSQYTSQLNLITCGGSWDNTTHAYSDRVVVVASLQP